jgi:hypothetical protein
VEPPQLNTMRHQSDIAMFGAPSGAPRTCSTQEHA